MRTHTRTPHTCLVNTSNMLAQADTHAPAHIVTHTHMHVYVLTQPQTRSSIHPHVHGQTCEHGKCARDFQSSRIILRLYVNSHTHTHTCILTYIRKRIDLCTYMWWHKARTRICIAEATFGVFHFSSVVRTKLWQITAKFNLLHTFATRAPDPAVFWGIRPRKKSF